MNSEIYDNTRINGIIKNYKECVGLLNQFFDILFDEVCGPCIEGNGKGYRGRGCCTITDNRIKTGGPASEKIEEMRTELKNKALAEGREISEHICEYFETGKGCILGDIKPEPCVGIYCNSRKINEKYDIDFNESRVRRYLNIILNDDRIELRTVKEGIRPEFVQDFKGYIQHMIDSVQGVKNDERKSDTDTRPF